MISMTEQKVKIGNYFINFVISKLKDAKVEKTLFLIPAGIGTLSTTFTLQLENLPKLLPNFQIISYDPPGIGKSQPPSQREFKVDGKFDANRQDKDAEDVVALLNYLKVDKFCLLGWCYAGNLANIIASKFPNRVEKIILLTSFVYVDDKILENLERTRDVSLWSERGKKSYIELYGFDGFKERWSEFLDFINSLKDKKDENIQTVKKIQAQTLIIHGEADFIVNESASKFLHESIKNSKLVTLKGPNSTHTLHVNLYEELNQHLADFLNET